MRKFLALMLVLALVLTMASFPAFADAPVVSLLGANIRLESADTLAGIRFGATIDKASAGIDGKYVYSEENDVKFGMYLLPSDLLGEAETLTDYIAAGGDKALDIPAKKIYAQDDESLTYTAVVTGIPEKGYARELVAVPYVVAGGSKTFHAEAKDSYVAVAQKALDSYNGENENGITAEDAEALEKIVEAGTPAVLVEKKVELTTDSIALNRYFASSGWAGPDSDFTPNLALVVDGSLDTYAYSGVWGGPTDVTTQGFVFELVIDLGAEKNLSKINVHAGAENYGNGWQFAAPLNPEILVAGEDEVYSSVYSYTAEANDAYRLDSVALDYTAEGAGIRYIKYAFSNIYANPSIAEVEVYEMAAGGSNTPDTPDVPDEPNLDDFVGEPVEIVLGADNVITYPAGEDVEGTPDLFFDNDTDYGMCWWWSWGTNLTPPNNKVVEIDLGAEYLLSEVTLNWGTQGLDGWGYSCPEDYSIYYGDANKNYTLGINYTDIHAMILDTSVELPDGWTASRRTDPGEFKLEATTTPAEGTVARYIKIEVNAYSNGGVDLTEITVVGVAGTAGEGGDTPDTPETPEEPAEPTLIDRIIVTGEGIEADATIARPLSNIVDGVSGLSNWADDYSNFYQSTPFATAGDGTTPVFTLTFDLGKIYNVTSFSIAREWNGAEILAGSLYGSNDKETWTPLRTGTIQTAWGADFAGGYYYYTTFTGAQYRYFKLDVTKLSSATYVKLHEIEFFGVPAGEVEGPTLGKDGPVFDPNDDSYLDFVPTGDEDSLRVVEWNLLSPEIGASEPETRFEGVEYLFENYNPDICGLVECCHRWRDALEGYDYFAENYALIYDEFASYYRATGMSVVAYRKDKFKEIDHGGTLFTRDGRTDERGIMWAALEEIESGRKFIVAITHLAPDGADEVREIEMEEFTEQMAEIRQIYNYPLLVIGDFNAYPEDIGMAEFQVNNNVAMTRTEAENIIADGPTCGRWIIDYTFADKRFFYPLNYSTIDGTPAEVSDHNPSYSDLLWKDYQHPAEQ